MSSMTHAEGLNSRLTALHCFARFSGYVCVVSAFYRSFYPIAAVVHPVSVRHDSFTLERSYAVVTDCEAEKKTKQKTRSRSAKEWV